MNVGITCCGRVPLVAPRMLLVMARILLVMARVLLVVAWVSWPLLWRRSPDSRGAGLLTRPPDAVNHIDSLERPIRKSAFVIDSIKCKQIVCYAKTVALDRIAAKHPKTKA